MEKFITNKTTLTPLLAGTITMTITGTLVSHFNFPGDLTSIVVSLILALLVTIDGEVSLLLRIIYYLINSITIFSVAMGINSAGVAANQNPQNYVERQIPSEFEPKAFFTNWF